MSTEYLDDYPSAEQGFLSVGREGRLFPEYMEMARYFKNYMGLICIDNYNYLYDEGVYKPISNDLLRRRIIELTQEKAKISWVETFLKNSLAYCQIERENFTPPKDHVNLSNGVLSLKTKRLIPHSKDYYFKYKIPIKFDSQAGCPNFMAFLNNIFEGDYELVDVIFEIFGYCLLGGNPFLHKAFAFVGSGRNGKSTLLSILKALLGDENWSPVSMALINKPFSAVNLDGKLANITGEIPSSRIDAEAFKSVVGGETIMASHKGKDEYALTVQARFVFACNEMPRFGDTTNGLWERLYILPFNRYFTDEERDSTILSRLLPELPGILNKSLEGLDRLLTRGRLPEIKSVKDMLNEYRMESDSVYNFFQEKIVVSNALLDKKTHNKELYSQYCMFCASEGCNHVGLVQFSKRMDRIIKNLNTGDKKVLSKRTNQGRIYYGLSYKKSDSDSLFLM